jgi:hypothetical protein
MPKSECTPNNKEVISVTLGDLQNTPMGCLMNGQSKLASIAIAPKENDGTYYIIKCEPKKIN